MTQTSTPSLPPRCLTLSELMLRLSDLPMWVMPNTTLTNVSSVLLHTSEKGQRTVEFLTEPTAAELQEMAKQEGQV